MTETWLPIKGYEDRYEVSDQGRVRNMLRGNVLQPWCNRSNPYPTVRLRNGEKSLRIHVLMLEAFIGPRPPGAHACHTDDNKTNNVLSNLRWDTKSENQIDRVRNGNHFQANKTHCPQGHEYGEDGFYIGKRKGGSTFRMCKICHRQRTSKAKRKRNREPVL